MNETTKQRLVGVIVLGCLAIIFVPMLLDGSGVTPPEIAREIPPMPTTPPVPVIEPVRPVIDADLEQNGVAVAVNPEDEAEMAADEDEVEAFFSTIVARAAELEEVPGIEAPAAPPEDLPRLDEQGIPEGWSVRLGSFSQQSNAEALLSRVRNRGHRGYMAALDSGGQRLSGVFVGPVLTRAAADDLRRQLQEEFQLEGLVVRYTITELNQ